MWCVAEEGWGCVLGGECAVFSSLCGVCGGLVVLWTKTGGDERSGASVVWVWPVEGRLGRGCRDEEKKCEKKRTLCETMGVICRRLGALR